MPRRKRSGYLFAQVISFDQQARPGSSVGTSVRLKIGRSAVRPRPWPLSEPQVITLVTCGFVRLGVRSPMTRMNRETPGLTASCPELGHGYRCGASLMRSGIGTSSSAGHDVYRPAGSDDDDGSAVLAHFVRGVARGGVQRGVRVSRHVHLGPCSPPVTPSADRPLLPKSARRMTRFQGAQTLP